MHSIKQIAKWLQSAEAGISNPETVIRFLSVDSRRIVLPGQTLFFALQTNRRDGHSFIAELYDAGIRNFVVLPAFDSSAYRDANFFCVENTLSALQQIASLHRRQFTCPVVAITGSNGKTIVKEWLYQLLSPDKNITRSPRSYNSQTGVPLSVWQMDAQTELAIFEAGISEPGEMDALEKVILPDIGIITNIGPAHDSFFASREEKSAEKLKLFTQCKAIIAPADDAYISVMLPVLQVRSFTWGYSEQADVRIQNITTTAAHSNLDLRIMGENHLIQIPFTDQASIQNALTCICFLVYMGMPVSLITERIISLHPVEMRLQILPAIHDCVLLNDSYSFDMASLAISLEFLEQQAELPKTVILSDLPHSRGDAYAQILHLLQAKQVSRLLTIGKEWQQHISEINIATHAHFDDTAAFFEQVSQYDFKREAILLKGARSFGFEKIAVFLERKVHQTLLEINLTTLIHNLNAYRSHLKPGTKVMAMVKASGYGSGSAEVALALQYHKADYLAVAYADEGAELRRAGLRLPVMVMNTDTAAFSTIIQYNLEPEIYTLSIYYAFDRFLNEQGLLNYPVHIKIDTGMHRLGFAGDALQQLVQLLKHNKRMFVKSVFSHLASGEDAVDDVFTEEQAALFAAVCQQIETAIGYTFVKHIANSAAAIRKPALQLDMVRLGIGLYGMNTSGIPSLQLQTVASFKTTIAQLHHLRAGDTVGYNRRGKITRDSVIATLRVGYADGYPRALSNGMGRFYIRGLMAPVVGTIAMDMLMVDVSHIPEVKEGDEAEAFGKHIPIEDLAAQCNTIAYEILTGIGQRVKRVYVEE